MAVSLPLYPSDAVLEQSTDIPTGFMTFCPEWLVGNVNLDGSNFMYLWVYLFFFNMLWVFIPLYAIWYSVRDISAAFSLREKQVTKKKSK
jgi:hypothetical protein